MDTTDTTPALTDHPFQVTGEHPDADKRVRGLVDVVEVIQPVIAADGGSLDVLGVDVATGVVRLRLSGACGSCAVSAATLNDGIDRIMKQRLDWVTEIIGTIEESDDMGLGGWVPKHS